MQGTNKNQCYFLCKIIKKANNNYTKNELFKDSTLIARVFIRLFLTVKLHATYFGRYREFFLFSFDHENYYTYNFFLFLCQRNVWFLFLALMLTTIFAHPLFWTLEWLSSACTWLIPMKRPRLLDWCRFLIKRKCFRDDYAFEFTF